MALANITERIRLEYLERLAAQTPTYSVRPLRFVESPGEAVEVELEIVPAEKYINYYVKLSSSLKATTDETEETPSGRRILARAPSGKALPSGLIDTSAFKISDREVVTAYLLPSHPFYEKLVDLISQSKPTGPPLADAQHLARTTCGVWLWV